MATYVVCDDATGAAISAGICADADVSAMAGAGQTAYSVQPGVVAWPSIDLTTQRDYLRTLIDQQAGAFRLQFITDVPGQAQTYEKKEAEARLWTSGDEITNPDRYPFMIAEATVRAIPISQVRSEIMAQVNMLTPLAAIIEAHRVAAKQAILVASTLPDMFSAAQVDWQGLLP